MTAAWVVILLAAAWVGFAYVGYPAALLLLSRVRRTAAPEPGAVVPAVSVIIAVHDGERELKRKLENTLLVIGSDPGEVIVSSDGSRDATEEIAASFADRGVRLVRSAERRGKEAAQARGIAAARGEILVFTDVASQLEPGALRAIVAPFADPRIGCVSSEDVVESESGEGLYVRLEMALRRLESERSTLLGLSGSFFAVRRALADPWPSDLASDFRIALEAARRGMRAVSEPRARARFGVASDPSAEWARKVRTVRRGLSVLAAYRDLLHPRFGRVAFSLLGHKVARFTSPFALLVVLVTSAAVAAAAETGRAAGLALFATQVALYGCGALGLVARPLGRFRIVRTASFFVLVNASILVAWAYHVSGRRAVTWQPTRR